MSSILDQMKSQSETLTPSEKAELASFLLSSMSPDEVKDAEDYRTEIQRRVQEIRSGKAVGIPVEEVLAELRSRIK